VSPFRFRAKHKVQVRTTVVDAELGGAIKDLLAQPGPPGSSATAPTATRATSPAPS
jgi:hypothetical protein